MVDNTSYEDRIRALEYALGKLVDPGVNGILVRNGSTTPIVRSIAAGSTKVTITNADGTTGNPTVDVAPANFTGIPESGVTNLVTDLAAKATPADIATHAALTATHGATGAVVGTTNAQTLTNKTINAVDPLTVGAGGSSTNQANLILDGGTTSFGNGIGVQFKKNSVEQYRLYQNQADPNLYLRDQVNGVMKLTIQPGGAGLGSFQVDSPMSVVSGVATSTTTFNADGTVTGGSNSWAGALTGYVPVLSGTGWAQGNGTLTGTYKVIGKMMYVDIHFTFGTTSTFGSTVKPEFSLPGAYTWRNAYANEAILQAVVTRAGVNDALARGVIGTAVNRIGVVGTASSQQGVIITSTYAGFTGFGVTGDRIDVAGWIPIA